MQWPLIENQVRLQYKLLGHEGFYTRVRNSNEKDEKYLFGLDAILDWARSRSGRGNLYISRNPFTKDGAVAAIGGFTLDLDPVREPKNRAASQDELRSVYTVAGKIGRYFGGGVVCTSGNGVLLIYPFAQRVTAEIDKFTESVKRLESQIIDRFSTKEVRIDATNYAKAILRLMGSVNCKDADSRKWRYAKFLSKPVFRAKRSSILDAIKGIDLSQSVTVPQLDGETNQAAGTGLPSTGVDSDAESCRLGPTARLALAEESLRRLGVERVNNYDQWIKCGIALKEFGAAGLHLWREWSKRSPKYQTGDCERKWNSFGFQPSLTVGSLKYWADADDPGRGMLRTVQSVGNRPTLWTPKERGFGRVEDTGRTATPTGFKWLDGKLNGGYRPGVVYAVEACTNVGKSAYIIQAAQNSCQAGRRVLLVTTEASIEEVCQRYWAVGTGISTSEISNGGLTGDRRQCLERYQEQFRTTHQLGVWYTVSPKTEEIERQISDFKPDIVLWDYFQHFETGTESRQIQLGSLARWFESTSLRHSIPFVVAAQLHERYDFKNRKRLPSLKDDIKDCKVLNDAAKTVIVLDWDSKQHDADGPVITRVNVEKNKGPVGEGRLLLNRQVPRFEEL